MSDHGTASSRKCHNSFHKIVGDARLSITLAMMWHKIQFLRRRQLWHLFEYYQEKPVSVIASTTRVNYHSSLPTSRHWDVNKATRDTLRNNSKFPETQPRDDILLLFNTLGKKRMAIRTEGKLLCQDGGEPLYSGKYENDTNLSLRSRRLCQRGQDTRNTTRFTQ